MALVGQTAHATAGEVVVLTVSENVSTGHGSHQIWAECRTVCEDANVPLNWHASVTYCVWWSSSRFSVVA